MNFQGLLDIVKNIAKPVNEVDNAMRSGAEQGIRTFLPQLINPRPIEQPRLQEKYSLPTDRERQLTDQMFDTEAPFRKAMQNMPSPTLTPPSMPMPTKTPQRTYDWNELQDYFANQATELGYDPGTLVSQKALESQRGQSNFAKDRNNFGGIGAYDSDPNQALTFKDVSDYMQYYNKMIQNNFPNAYNVRDNPDSYIQELLKGGEKGVYATDPEYEWKIKNTPEYKKYR